MMQDIIASASARLSAAGVDTPEHDAKLLLAEACGVELRDIDKAMLMGERMEEMLRSRSLASASHDGEEAPARDTRCDAPCRSRQSAAESDEAVAGVMRRFESMVTRRAKREPLQYIVGHAPFRYLDLEVGPGVFIPRPETETVVQAGLDWLTVRHIASPLVVDLCAGSGAIGLSVAAEVPGSHVWAVELSERTAEWARRNMRRAARSHSGVTSNYHLEIGDATSPYTLSQLDGTIDMVITNPPYVPLSAVPEQPEVRDWDPELALYGGSADGTLIPERIIARAFTLLKPGGLLVMEHDVTQGDRLACYAHAAGFADASTGKDWTGRDRYLIAGKALAAPRSAICDYRA